MQSDTEELIRKAVKFAISQDWESAKDYNLRILEQDDRDVDAKVRLGKAYLELHDYAKARKCFREVLIDDPINVVAKRNLDLAKEEKQPPATNGKFANIIQEPATFIQTSAEITVKGFTASKLPMGSDLEVKVFSQFIKLYYIHRGQKIDLAVIRDPKIVRRLKRGKDLCANFTGTFVKGVDKNIIILIKSSLPIFEGERQELKPYTKRNLIDPEDENEPDISVEES